MSDNQEFPALDIFKELELLLYSEKQSLPGRLEGLGHSINTQLDQIGFTDAYVTTQIKAFKQENLTDIQVEERGSAVSKVIKDVIWGMIELDVATVAVLDTPILQRLRYVRQNGFTYLVYPPASHTRFEHSLGVFAVASKYIASINTSATQPRRFADGLVPVPIGPKLALDIKHAALLHDIGHMPFSHVLERIFESAPVKFKLGHVSVRDFEICFMRQLPNIDSRLGEKLKYRDNPVSTFQEILHRITPR
jgi:hypothetical protein